ncbi:glycine zipper 2TM domain-containing protein [Novosphingobium sp.]|uniref:glycine zipper 2TM domain-containing protein n=1 Tax=Novosphingobium sp. TaxID=1874826 RepID=UPI002613CFF2|nr:glycine zipper 2TM domain-containing protein [Novosphingobium sp.]
MARLLQALVVAAMTSSLAVPALARGHQTQVAQGSWQSGYPGAYQGSWQGQYPVQYPVYGAPVYAPPVYSAPVYNPPVYSAPAYNGQVAPPQGYVPAPQAAPDADPRYREMVERCQGVTTRHSGTTGAVIGGVVGGVVGNRVASGNRTIGTVAGAAVGAVAGGAIGKSVDKNRERECEEFFSSYAPPAPAYYGYGAPAGGYAYGYPSYGYAPMPGAPMTGAPMGYVMVPANAPQAVAPGQGACTETRTVSYEYVPVKKRYIGAPPRRPVVHDKRVKVPSGS